MWQLSKKRPWMINELSPKLRKHTLTLEKNNTNNIVTDRKTNKNSKYFVHGMVDLYPKIIKQSFF